MGSLFEQTSVNGISLSNRFVRSATWMGMANEKGEPTPQLTNILCELADNEVGLIITGFTYVRKNGKCLSRQLGAHRDESISRFKELTRAVHKRNGKIVLQLVHGGYFSDSELINGVPLAPSKVKINEKNSRRAMSKQDIKELIELFADASKRGKEANFDGIQLHMAHGYLFSQFLSPLFNQRRDEYGGDIESRAKFPVEVLKGIRKNVGPDFPVLAKLNCRDYHEKGLSLEESIQVGKFLEEAGLDAIELSGGLLINEDLNPSRKNITSEKDEAYFEEEAKIFKAEIDIPLMLVGGIRSYSVAKRIISENTADYVSMSRPLIREPNLIKRWHAGDHRKATCTSCNECFKAGYSQKVFCPIENRQNISN
ncbi:hypothetical protein AKJ36_01450 [candidate division MSBL1 archaeon SCGC-AAA259I07]|uniref:NADH:flavin oxidoreductase/NADH oxidase N-terminal domain-containing protein n=4 Tax=candidate division MSBL1 TaxID=215777 RepID=A0A133ULX2_9EURY|nr:hypothetical protein AKJ36_01450 [candidate division MSBL1 archaeon SCGC-AAA259I07]